MIDYSYDYLFDDDDYNDINHAKGILKNVKEVELLKREINSYSYVKINNYTKVLRKNQKDVVE